MKVNFKKKKYLFNLFLFFYIVLGFYLSVNTGITADEFSEQEQWKINFEAIKDFFGANNNGYSNLLEYHSRFHGIGFQFFL